MTVFTLNLRIGTEVVYLDYINLADALQGYKKYKALAFECYLSQRTNVLSN